MIQWEYKQTPFNSTELESLGKQGWELVSIDRGWGYYKRPLITKVLEALEEFKNRVHQQYNFENSYPKPNGLSCPSCGKELRDVGSKILTCYPPQRTVDCVCGFEGYRLT